MSRFTDWFQAKSPDWVETTCIVVILLFAALGLITAVKWLAHDVWPWFQHSIHVLEEAGLL